MLIETKSFSDYNIAMVSEKSKEIKKNLAILNDDIKEIAESCGRNFNDIKLMAVSKTKPKEDVIAAYQAGQRLFGENRIAEAAEKFKNLPNDIDLHMIGNLQTNKAGIAVKTVNCVQSVHKIKTARELNKKAEIQSTTVDFLIEINTSKEESKEGYLNFDDVLRDLNDFYKFKFLRLRGLMTVGPFTSDVNKIRKSFSDLYKYFEKLKTEISDEKIDTLSMGMSSDYRIAIEEGSTLIRVGTSIFGSRNFCLKN